MHLALQGFEASDDINQVSTPEAEAFSACQHILYYIVRMYLAAEKPRPPLSPALQLEAEPAAGLLISGVETSAGIYTMSSTQDNLSVNGLCFQVRVASTVRP